MSAGPRTRGRLGGIGEAFADRNFRIYSLGALGSWISFFVQLVAVSWLTWELTASTTWLAIMALLDIVPSLLLMPLAGALADRHDRHAIMILTSVLLLGQAGAMALLSWLGLLTVWPLALLVLLHGVFVSFMVPAMYGTLPRFVARRALSSSIAVAAAYTQLALFAGPALGGWIIARHGLTWAFVVNVLGYALLVATFLCLRTPPDYEKPSPSSKSVLGDILEGFAYIRGNAVIAPLLWLLLISDALAIGFTHMLPAYSELVLGMGVAGVSTLLACRGLGATAAALWLAHGGAEAARLERVLWSALIALLALVALVETGNLYLAAAIAVVMGFAGETRKTGTVSIVQLSVEEKQRGRVIGTLFMFSQLAAGIGAYGIGAVAAHTGLRLPTLVGVAIGVAVWLAVYLRWRRRPG